MPRLTQSGVWSYFKLDEHDREKSKCNICNKIYSRKGRTTSSLRNHLKSMHPELFSLVECDDNEIQLQKKKMNQIKMTLRCKKLKHSYLWKKHFKKKKSGTLTIRIRKKLTNSLEK
ncbi:PREDICTED: uncharacterized protein LOC108363111 [Rhagoletis zephyria]|uniref:uncharacterized protein LOC108363111 n=1 Tax=Rhagoletis zephyria TaxID=28612 RepID=UPI000811A922|nr:PREDICTED: uncharacterized protein LOC108363111 [Rhagoletis zephyria]